MSRGVIFKGFDRCNYQEVSRGVHSKTSSMDQRGIKELSRGHELSQLIHLAIKRCRDCDKKQLKSSIDNLGIERCQGSVEIA